MSLRYDFVRVTRDDYPMLRRWLAEPHVQGWWGSPDHEIDTGPTDMRIVIDPEPHNTRAIATYRGAGFVPLEERDCGDGHRALLMEFKG